MDNSTLQPLTSPTQNTSWSQSDVVRLNDATAVTLIPAMMVIGLYMVVGVPGNLLVCYVMGFKLKMNTQNLLIVCLAVFDLLSCLISMPTDIYIMRYLYTFPSQAACKAFRTITTFASIGSIFTLVVIAVDRYWKICQPVNVQMNLRKVKFSLIFVLLGAAFISWPIIIIYGFRTIDSGIPGFPGQDCSVSDDSKDTIFPLVYMSILFLVFIIVFVVLIILYYCILFSTKRHRRYMRSKRLPLRSNVMTHQNEDKNSTSGDITSGNIFITKASMYGSGQQKEKNEDPSSSATHPSTSTNMIDEITDNNEGNEDTVAAISHEKEIPCVSGLEDHQGVNVDCDMNNGQEDGECNVHSTGIQTDSSMGQKQDEYGVEQNNKKDNGYDMTGAEDEDCQEHSNGKRNDYGLKSVDDEDCQEHSNEKRNDSVLWSAGEEDGRKDSNEELSFSRPNIQLANTNIKSFDCGRVSMEKMKLAPSCNKSDEEYPKHKVSGHSLVFVQTEKNLENQKSSPASAKIDKTTIIAFLVTLVFILSFLPFLILQIVKLNIKGFDYNLKGPALIFYSICLRSYFINSMSNPFIYGVYNNQFRHEVYILLSRFCLKCKTVCQRAED